MTKAELQAECELAGLETGGLKAELQERLRAQADPNDAVE